MSGIYTAAAWEAVGTYFAGAAAGTAATTGTTVAATDAAATGATAAVGTGATATVGTVGTAGVGAAGTAGVVGGGGAAALATTAPTLGAIAPGIGDLTWGGAASLASTAATGVSALATLAQGSRGINVPPQPGQVGTDESAANAEQASLRRSQIAGGLQSTTGTAGGQAGAVLNPATLSTKSLLGG
jgi:hypothetical protein